MKKISKNEVLEIGKNAKEASRFISLLEPNLKNQILKAKLLKTFIKTYQSL